MKKCKNIECENNISDYRTYCSLTCRNIYVNKHIRDYSKVSNTISQKSVESYKKNKKHCLNPECGKEIPYEKKRNKKHLIVWGSGRPKRELMYVDDDKIDKNESMQRVHLQEVFGLNYDQFLITKELIPY